MPQRLAQHLIARGLLPARVVDEALRRLGREGGTLDSVLLEMGAVSEAGMLQAISDVSGVRLVNQSVGSTLDAVEGAEPQSDPAARKG